MDANVSSLLLFSLILFLTTANTAIEITQILSANPNFSQFSSLLTQTKVAEQINGRQSITVLVVNNVAMSSIAGKPQDVLKKILSVHVILDYYDMEKLTKVSITNRSGPSLTTLFQASGQALNQQGFLTVSLMNEGEVTFGSSVQGATMNSMLVKSVSNHPNIISVLQISQPIEVPGIETPYPNASKDNIVKTEAPLQASAPTLTQAQSPSRKIGVPTASTDEKAQAQPTKDSAPTQESAAAPDSNKDSAASSSTQKTQQLQHQHQPKKT